MATETHIPESVYLKASEECENDKTEPKLEESDKHEDQENEQEVNTLDKDQGKVDFTNSQDVLVEGDLLEKNFHSEEVEGRESIEEDTQEIKSSAETLEQLEQQRLINVIPTDVCISTQIEPDKTTETQEKNDEEAIESDDGQTKKPGIPMVDDICKETVLVSEKDEKAESEEGLKFPNSPRVALNENEIVRKDEDQELYVSEKDNSVGNDEDVKETTIGHVTSVANLEEEAEDKVIDAQEVSEQCDNGEKNKEEENPAESVKLEDQEKEQEVNMLEKDQGQDEIARSQEVAFEGSVQGNHHSEGIEQEVVTMKARIVEDIEERSSVEASDRAEQESLINVIPTDVCIPTQTEPEEKTIENEEKKDEKAICQENVSEHVEYEEGLKLSDSPSMEVKRNEIESKDEYQETGQDVSEKGQGGEDDILSSKNASIEDITESTHGQQATTVADFEEEKGVSAMTEEIISEKAKDKPIDAQEISSELGQPKEQNVKETTTNEKTEDEITKKGEDSSHDNMEDTNDNTIKDEKCSLKNEPVEEQNGRSFDEVSKENLMDLNDTNAVEPQEDITLSGTSGTLTEDTLKSEKAKGENEVLPIDEDLEPVSEIQIIQVVPSSEEKETVTEENSSDEKTEQTIEIKQETSSEKAGSEGFKLSDGSDMEINEKVMTTFNDEDQEKGQEVNISAEGQRKDNVTSTQDADVEEEVLQEKNYQNKDNEHGFVETRESIETRKHKSESPLFSEVCEATSSEKAEPEDGANHSESFNTNMVEDETVSKEENLEKKQELMSEVQGDVISSDNVSNEVIKETTIGQCETTVVDFEEGQDLNATTNKILVEEVAEDKSVDAQEESDPCEIEAKDKSEQTSEESVDKPLNSYVEIAEENVTEDHANARNKEIEAKLDKENQADITEDKSEVKDEVVSTEKMSSEHGEPKEQNIKEIEACLNETVTEKSENEMTKKEDLSQENIEDPNDSTTREEKRPLEHEPTEELHGGLDEEVSKKNLTNLNETNAVEPHEDTTPSSSLETSTEDCESVSEEQIPQVVPKLEATTKEILSDEKFEAYGEHELMYESTTDEHINETTQQADKSYITSEENVSQLEQIGENDSPYEKSDGTQENQLNSIEECGEMVKDVILTEKISYADLIPVINRKVTEVRIETQMGQEDLQAAEDISCEPIVDNESVDEAPKEEIISSLEEVKTIELEVDLSNIESTAYSSESEKLPIPALESVCDSQASGVSADSEDREVKEECIVLATAQHTNENKSEEEQKNNTNEILSVPQEENVKQVPDKSNEEKTDLNSKEKSSIEESLELRGEFKPTSESIIEVGKVKIIEPQPEQSDFVSGNIMNDPESKLEHMTQKDLGEGKKDMEEDLIHAPEYQIKRTENQNEIMKNVILTDEVSQKDNCPTELDKTSTSNQKELANEVELSKPIVVANTEVTAEVKAESKIEIENIQSAEDVSFVPNASSTVIGEVKDDSVDEASNNEIIPAPEIESTDTPLNEQDSMKQSCSSQQTVDKKVELVSQLTDREILEAPDVEFDNKKRDEEQISDVQPPEVILKMEVKEEHPEATNDTCEPLIGVDLIEKKLVSTVPPEDLTSPIVEDQTNELSSETDKTKIEPSSISNTYQNPKFMEEEFTETFSEDQTRIKERYIEEERKGNFSIENKEEKSGNEVVEDVTVSEVLLEDETEKEIKSIKDNINEEDIHNQITSATDEICKNERTSSSPDELAEKKDSVIDTEDPKLMAESFNIKDESFTVMKAQEFESLENMGTKENIIKTDANKEKETLNEPQAYDTAQTTSDLVSSSTEQNIEVRSGDSRDGEVSNVVEIVSEGREASAFLTENLQEASPEAKHDPEITTATEKIEDKKPDCLSVEKTGELQVSTLNSEIDEGKPGDMQNKATEVVQPQESSEDNTLLSQNDNKNEDSLVLPSVEKDTKQGIDTRFEEAPVIDVIKHEKGLDHTTEDKSFDVASNAECSEIEPPHLDTKEVTSELISLENKKEADENMETLIPVEDVKSNTKVKSVDLEIPSVMDPKNKKDEAYDVEKGVPNDNEHLESTGDRSKPIEEISGIKQELDAPVTLGTGATDELKIPQKDLTHDVTKISETQPETQKHDASAAYTVDKQSQNEATAKSEVENLNIIKAAASIEPKCRSEVLKEDEKMSDEKDISPEATKVNSQVGDKNIIGEREVVLTKDEKVDKEVAGDEENEEEEEEDNEKTGDAPVMVEASKDMEVKVVHKKSHNILSGVGSKMKHSIAKVKKAITGKSSHTKPPSP